MEQASEHLPVRCWKNQGKQRLTCCYQWIISFTPYWKTRKMSLSLAFEQVPFKRSCSQVTLTQILQKNINAVKRRKTGKPSLTASENWPFLFEWNPVTFFEISPILCTVVSDSGAALRRRIKWTRPPRCFSKHVILYTEDSSPLANIKVDQ